MSDAGTMRLRYANDKQARSELTPHHWLCRLALIALMTVLLGACAESNPEAEQAAAQASEPWLALMDKADYAGCWQAAAPLFRDQEALESWLTKAEGYRAPLGDFKSRQINDTTYIVDPWFAPPGEYAIVVYDSHWNAGSIYETLHMQRQVDGGWLVAGYSVRQQ